MFISKFKIIFACISLLAFTGISLAEDVKKSDETLEQSVILNLIDHIVLKNYELLQNDLNSLKIAIKTFQTQPDTTNLIKAQKSWRQSRIGFEVAETHLFGPVISLGIDPALDSWPLDQEQLQLTVDIANQLTEEKLTLFSDSVNDDVSGFHALEFILFGANNDQQPKNITQSQIAYALLIVDKMINHVDELNVEWTGEENYRRHLVAPGKESVYANNQAILQEFVTGMIGIINEVGTGKLIDPLGGSIATASPELVESQFSWNSTEDFFWNIVGVKQIWEGNYYVEGYEHTGQGIRDIVAAKDMDLAKEVDQLINDAIIEIVKISQDEAQRNSQNQPKDIATLKRSIIQNDFNYSFKHQVTNSGGRAQIKKAESALDELQAILEESILSLI